MRRLVAIVALAQAAAVTAGDYFRPEGDYDSRIPTPAQVLGFELGDRPARPHALVRYFETLAERSPYARLERHGQSHEGRDLVHLIVTSEANHARLAAVREAVQTLADPRVELDGGRLQTLLDETPAIAYMAYSIHGDEVSGADAALRVAYELVAGRDQLARLFRDQLVVLIDPAENPDGRERFLAMTTAFSGMVPNPDPDSLNHTAFWPWGRTNHYLFDLNRDWFALVHPESRARADILREWRPQLVVDAHEMGGQSTFLFNPPREPFNPNLPSSTLEWWQRFGAGQAAAFDRYGWSYYTGEWNEEFFPGYGSSLALYQGAVAILYEQASTEGGPLRKRYGGTLQYRQAVRHQFVSSLANLETAARSRRELLVKYRDARAEAVDRAGSAPMKAFYWSPQPEPARAARLASSLSALGIEVERTAAGGSLRAAHDLWSDGRRDVDLPEGSYRVRLAQPDGLLARALLEPHTPMDDASLAEEREHLERQKGSRIYDTTAWSPLLSYGVRAWWSKRADNLEWERIREARPPLGSKMTLARWRPDEKAPYYGLVFDGTADAAPVLAAHLAAAGARVRVSNRPFPVGDRSYPRGSYLIRVEENPELDPNRVVTLAAPLGIDVRPAPTARIPGGPDLGGGHFDLLVAPRIAILAGAPTSFYSVGAAWHLLDKTYGLRVSLLDIAQLGNRDLRRYNVLVLPNVWGGAKAARRALGAAGHKALTSWVEDGGTLVAVAGGTWYAADEKSKLSNARARADVLEDFPAPRYGLGDDAVLALERLQATGLGPNGEHARAAGAYSRQAWPEELGIPGPGYPVLGPGTWTMLGELGERARDRELKPAFSGGGDDGESRKKKKAAKPSRSKEEKEKARKRADARLRRFHPSGAILRVELDPESWLSYGAGDKVAAMVRAGDVLIARDPVRTVGRYAPPRDLHLGGLLWPEAAGRIALTAFLTRERKGRGQVILFSDDPNFRGYFWGTQRLFLNAVLLGPGVGVRQPVPW